MKIVLPIFVYLKDTGELLKYDTLDFASTDLEAYDIGNYKAFDSKGKILKLYKKDNYSRVGYVPSYDKITNLYDLAENELHARGIKTDKGQDISNLIELIESEEERRKKGKKDFKLFSLWFPTIFQP